MSPKPNNLSPVFGFECIQRSFNPERLRSILDIFSGEVAA